MQRTLSNNTLRFPLFFGVVIFLFTVAGMSFPPASAKDKVLFHDYEEDIVYTPSPQLGHLTYAQVGDLMYSESASPEIEIFVTANDIVIDNQQNIVFPAGTALFRARVKKKKYYCYSKPLNEIPLTLPDGEHCFETDRNGEALVGYRFLPPGKKKLKKSVEIDHVSGTKEIVFPFRFENGQKIDVWDRVQKFSLSEINAEEIKISFPPDSVLLEIFKMVENAPNPDAGRGFIENLPHPEEQIVSLPFRGEKKTYTFYGLEITLLSLENGQLSYTIDKGFSGWMAFLRDGNFTIASLLDIAEKVEEK